MKLKTDIPRVYVACVAAYNSGYFHGSWINADQEPEEIEREIQEMLAKSPIANAEEWRIDDYVCLSGIGLHSTVESISDIGKLFAEDKYPYSVLDHAIDCLGDDADYDSVIEYIDNFYLGTYESKQAWAESYLYDTGMLDSMPKSLRYYFDYESYARDAEYNGMTFIQDGYQNCHVFHQ